jgi:diguanylate cyclase (GGDEF)-like protein
MIGLVLSLVLLVLNIAYSISATTRLSDSMRSLRSHEVELFDAAWQVRYLDEALTHSVAQYIVTAGDPQWMARYEKLVERLDAVLVDLRERGDQSILNHLDDVSAANDTLIELEGRIFATIDRGQVAEARRLLTGDYVEAKDLYQKGLDAFFAGQRASIDRATQQSEDDAQALKFSFFVVGSFLTVSLVALANVHRRQVRMIDERDVERDHEFAWQSFEQRLDRALDLAQSEDQALVTIRGALEAELASATTELLVADSSHAHLRQVMTTERSPEKPGCGVASPRHCPAIRTGSSLVFTDTDRYDACPHLRERSLVGCSAICTPVSITGTTSGVLHTIVVNSDGTPTEALIEETVRFTDRISSRTGERLGVLRAFATSQLQAATDPLTGLLNRRSLEARAKELLAEAGSLTVMYFDLDHFKSINDTHGHDTGDRALRQFSKMLRDCTRSSDVVGRWGGEEFVAVLPGGPESATPLYERIRESLVLAGAIGNVPALTTSAGVASSLHGETFSDTVARADEALLHAKASGRDRLEFADLLVPSTGQT